MLSRSSWLHLRIPFSYFLLPVFLFSLSVSPNLNQSQMFWVFFIVHFLLYPASNGYNSYFDKDEKSIGGLKNPPPVNRGLYFLSLAFDMAALILGFLMVNLTFSLMLLIYGLISKAYSHPSLRLKKYAISSWLVVGLFQGLFTFAMCYIGLNKFTWVNIFNERVIIPGLLSTLLLLGTYPITQVYQHEEDSKRGDRTFSILLGVKGTFYFVAAIFAVATIAFGVYFNAFFDVKYAKVFVAILLPVVVYFVFWFIQVLRHQANADHRHTMRLNFISSTCLNGFFIYLFLDSSHVLQTFR